MNPEKEVKKVKNRMILARYLPEGYVDFVLTLFKNHPVPFKIVRPRTTKLGDFRVSGPNQETQITVNGDLNPYSFLITTVHEFAHLITFKKYGFKPKPHGKEWQQEYSKLIIDLMDVHPLPKDIETALLNSLVSVKASSCTDLNLMRVLKNYDNGKLILPTIETLAKNATFVYQNREFKLIEKRRTRYLCEELNTKKRFLFHALVEIEQQ